MNVTVKSLANGTELLFQPMREENLPFVVAIEKAVHYSPWSIKNFQDSLRSSDQCWTISIDHKIVGYGIVSCAGGDAELLNIALDHHWRRHGFARALLLHLIELVKLQAETLFLEVRQSNDAAIALYQSLEFNEVGVRPNYYPDKKGREDALIFAKSLSET